MQTHLSVLEHSATVGTVFQRRDLDRLYVGQIASLLIKQRFQQLF